MGFAEDVTVIFSVYFIKQWFLDTIDRL